MWSGDTENGQLAPRCVTVAFTSPTVTMALRGAVARLGSISYDTVPVPWPAVLFSRIQGAPALAVH
jgi:hypothetical protein